MRYSVSLCVFCMHLSSGGLASNLPMEVVLMRSVRILAIITFVLLLAYYVLRKMTALVDGLVVHPDRMLENLDRSHGLVFSQPVLLALVASGMDRDAAYRIVQRDARLAWDEAKPLRMVLESDPEVPLSPAQLDDAFSLERALRHARRAIDALDSVEANDMEVP